MIVQIERAGPVYDLTVIKAKLIQAHVHNKPLDENTRRALLNLLNDIDFLAERRGMPIVRGVE